MIQVEKKKRIVLLLILLMALLIGCSPSSGESEPEAETETAVPETESEPAAEEEVAAAYQRPGEYNREMGSAATNLTAAATITMPTLAIHEAMPRRSPIRSAAARVAPRRSTPPACPLPAAGSAPASRASPAACA